MSNKNFQSKYPIMLAAMNQVSTLDFAVAANKSGIFPSISGFNYYIPNQCQQNSKINLEHLKKDLQTFNDLTGTNNLILSVALLDVFRDDFKELCFLNLFSHLEVVDDTRYILSAEIYKNNSAFENLENHFSILSSCGIQSIFKLLNFHQWIDRPNRTHKLFSGAVIKSSDAAGLVNNTNRKSIIEELKILKKCSPDKIFIPAGGIHSGKQIKECINAGAEIVGVGSYFVVAEESPISTETKQRIVSSARADVKKFNNTNHNGIIFSEVPNDDENHTNSLISGIKNPNNGHIFMGSAVDHVDKIKPLKDLVQELISDLN